MGYIDSQCINKQFGRVTKVDAASDSGSDGSEPFRFLRKLTARNSELLHNHACLYRGARAHVCIFTARDIQSCGFYTHSRGAVCEYNILVFPMPL